MSRDKRHRARAPAGKHPLVATTTPVSGLSRRTLPWIAVLAQSIAAVAPTGAAAVIPALVIASAGGAGAIVAFAAAAVVIMLVSACLRPMAERMATVGGLYTYVARGLGPLVALPTGISAIVGYAAVSMAGLVAVGTYLSHIAVAVGITDDTKTLVIIAVAIVCAALATLVMYRGIRMSARVTLLIECVSLALLAVVLTLVATRLRPADIQDASTAWEGSPQSLAISTVVAVSAFVGFESSTTLSGEARQPFLSVPRTLRWTPFATAAIYLVTVTVLAAALPTAHDTVRYSSTPLAALVADERSTLLSAALDLAIAASFFACTLASVNALVRVLFSMGREGVAPATLGRTHPRLKTPAHAIGAAMVVVTIIPMITLSLGISPDQALRGFLTLSACGYIGSYLAGCLAAPALLRRIGESTPGVVVLSAITSTLLFALVIIAVLVVIEEGAVVLTVYAALMGLGVVYTVVLRIWAPERLDAVGIYDETQRTDMLNTVAFR